MHARLNWQSLCLMPASFDATMFILYYAARVIGGERPVIKLPAY